MQEPGAGGQEPKPVDRALASGGGASYPGEEFVGQEPRPDNYRREKVPGMNNRYCSACRTELRRLPERYLIIEKQQDGTSTTKGAICRECYLRLRTAPHPLILS